MQLRTEAYGMDFEVSNIQAILKMPFKYAKQTADFKDCPPDKTLSPDQYGYRYVHNVPPTASDFIPKAVEQPNRSFSETQKCASYGLSFFTTQEKAKKNIEKLKEDYPQIEKTLGTHVQKIKLTPDHGVVTKKNRNGHFTLYEEASVKLEAELEDSAVVAL